MVEIVYIPTTGEAIQRNIAWRVGITVQDALNESLLLETYPELIDLSVGIFSQPTSLDAVLLDNDRVEFYRPLLLDPKEKRRERAKKLKR